MKPEEIETGMPIYHIKLRMDGIVRDKNRLPLSGVDKIYIGITLCSGREYNAIVTSLIPYKRSRRATQ